MEIGAVLFLSLIIGLITNSFLSAPADAQDFKSVELLEEDLSSALETLSNKDPELARVIAKCLLKHSSNNND